MGTFQLYDWYMDLFKNGEWMRMDPQDMGILTFRQSNESNMSVLCVCVRVGSMSSRCQLQYMTRMCQLHVTGRNPLLDDFYSNMPKKTNHEPPMGMVYINIQSTIAGRIGDGSIWGPPSLTKP